MNVMVVRGNPRKKGYTQHLTDLFVEGLREGGAGVDDIDLASRTINPCVGCYRCWTESPGRCFFRDDMDDLLPRLLECDVLVCATPLYFYGMSSSMRTFVERTLPLTREGFETTPGGLVRNRTRYPRRWSKHLVGLAAGAFKSLENFSGFVRTMELITDGVNFAAGGLLLRPESYLLQFSLAKPKTVKTVETAFVRAGMETAADGSISEQTLRDARMPLSIDQYHFRTYSNIYWEHVRALGSEEVDAIQRAVTTDIRILMHEMARSIDPGATARLRAVLQFDFPDTDYHVRIAVDRGSCTLEEGSTESPDLRVTVDSRTWAGVFMREIDAREALRDRRIVLDGDKSLFVRLERYFPPPSS